MGVDAGGAERPSAIAQTISDWPRPASPQTKTPSSLVWYVASRRTLPRASSSTPSCSSNPVSRSGPSEAHREQHQLPGSPARCPRPAGTAAVHRSTSTSRSPATWPVVVDELRGGHRVDPLAALLVRGGHPVDHRVRRPRLVVRTLVRRPRHDLQLGDRLGTLPVRRAEAVRAGVAAADDHHVLAGGDDLVRRRSSPSATRLACGRYSIAWWMPPSSRPGTGRSRPRSRRWRARPRRTARAAARR